MSMFLLDDWLMDIEAAVDLTHESRAKLAKAKLRGLTHTLVTEAINSDTSWEGIKDLLWLKLCNANIHTYTSCFMDIQQKEKESLAAYIHQFKTEAKRCNFTNAAATIRIFIKGLKSAHSLTTHIYEKGSQTLMDAISEVEKQNAAQQLMGMVIPPSTQLMWCQMMKIAVSSVRNQDILHDIALTLGAMSAMNMITLSWTVHTEYLLQEL